MANGIDITRIVYSNLRTPADSVLPFRTVLDKIREVVRKKKLDLSLSEQNSEAQVTGWFQTNQNDFEVGHEAHNIFLPIRVERRGLDSVFETGVEVPIVNHSVLDSSLNGAVAFYGNPMRMSFRQGSELVSNWQYRIIYEPDFSEDVGLSDTIALPDFFADMIASEASYLLIMLIPDNSPEFQNFIKMYVPVLQSSIIDWSRKWEKYVKKMRGNARVPKRTFFQNRKRRYGIVTDAMGNNYEY